MYRVLLIDDDEEVLQVNSKFLTGKGYKVYTLADTEDVFTAIKVFMPQCVVMDVMMPGRDGFTLLEQIRRETDVPVLFLTAKGEEADRIRGLSLGADDYILKPCSLEELSLRIMVNIRRQEAVNKVTGGVIEFSPLRVALLEHKAYYIEEEIPLSKREFEMLAFLAEHPGEVMEFERIGRKLSGTYIEADRKNIMMTASRLRKRLEGYVGLENMIETAWGKGYCFKGK